MLPSLLTELDQLLLVDELNQQVFKSALDPALVRMSLMTPSACLEEDYERLELQGDAFLKYVCSGESFRLLRSRRGDIFIPRLGDKRSNMSPTWTVNCFVTMEKTCHEGELHRKRLGQISNSELFIGGLKLNLPAYVVSRPFTSRQGVSR